MNDPFEDQLRSTFRQVAQQTTTSHDLGLPAESFTGSQAGIVTDTSHGRAKILEVRADRLRDALARGQVVIVAGFQGVSTESDVTTLGRGGSDTTAVALAAAMGRNRARLGRISPLLLPAS